jgi:hypothetical protein
VAAAGQEFFQTEFNISTGAFFVGEAVFMVWNSVNDPLFGWLSDVGGADQYGPAPPARARARARVITRFPSRSAPHHSLEPDSPPSAAGRTLAPSRACCGG